jgi:hypothetical protein
MLPTYKIIRSRRKTIALIIEPDGRLVVRAPKRVSNKEIKRLVAHKEKWVRKKQAEVQKNNQFNKPKSFIDGETLWYLGKTYPLKIVDDLAQPLVLGRKFYLARDARRYAREIFTEWYREQARAEVTRRAAYYTNQHGLQYRRIRITSARTRWGSCSSAGNLNFTWRLVMAPPRVINYVVAHEVAHLKIKNHSKSFWRLVEHIMPDYKRYQTWLKENGRRLTL